MIRKAVIVDVGGVLRNTQLPIAYATQRAMKKKLGLTVHYDPEDVYRFRALGRFIHTRDTFQALYAFNQAGVSLKHVLSQKNPHTYAELLIAKHPLSEEKLKGLDETYRKERDRIEMLVDEIEGASEALDLLKSRGVVLAIHTRTKGESVKRWLKYKGLAHYFEGAPFVAKEDVPRFKYTEPELWDPVGLYKADGLRKVLERLRIRHGIKPEETDYVGDTPSDIHAARSVGVRAIAVLSGRGAENILRAANPHEVHPNLLSYAKSLEQRERR